MSANTECFNLWKGIEGVVEWCTRNNLNLNVGKCSVSSYTEKVLPIPFEYKVSNAIVMQLDKLKRLGKLFDK